MMECLTEIFDIMQLWLDHFSIKQKHYGTVTTCKEVDNHEWRKSNNVCIREKSKRMAD